jgi:acyl-homoserine lactone acylase PvdQ
VPKALSAATVRKGKKATLRYRVNDGLAGCGKANATITIKTVKGRTVKTLPVVKGAAVNTDRKASFVCKLKPGTYYYWVAATDIAGNKGTKTASAKLTVK